MIFDCKVPYMLIYIEFYNMEIYKYNFIHIYILGLYNPIWAYAIEER